MARMQGTVKWFSDVKGYGFIGRDDGGDDVFVHFSQIEMKGHKNLNDNDVVEFELGKSEKTGKPQAERVKRIKAAAPVGAV